MNWRYFIGRMMIMLIAIGQLSGGRANKILRGRTMVTARMRLISTKINTLALAQEVT